MQVLLLIIFGFLAGIIGGMGMGGGTLLVPLLSFLNLSQKTIQAINLISFLPMCCVALIFHAKNKLVQTHGVGWVIVPATVCAASGAFFAGQTSDKILSVCFGVFLVAVGVWQMFVAIKFVIKMRSRLTVVNSPVRCLKGRDCCSQTDKIEKRSVVLKKERR